MPNVKTVTLTGGETAVTFEDSYPYYMISNMGDSEVYASGNPGIEPYADGVYTIPAGVEMRISPQRSGDTVYLLGSGMVQVRAETIAVQTSFKLRGKGGDNGTNIICKKFSGLSDPVKRVDNLNAFFSVFDAAFGSHISTHCHYADDIHSFAFSNNGMAVNLYINSLRAYSSCQFSESSPVYYIFSKNRKALYFYSETTANGTCYQVSVTAAKDSAGVWYVFLNHCTNDAWGTATFFCNTPNTTGVPYRFALKTAADLPYIISPCHDHSGGVFPEFFHVESLTASDADGFPVLTADNDLYAVPPYPAVTSDSAAFAIPIDPEDYEQEV